jgi:hypothetical protein
MGKWALLEENDEEKDSQYLFNPPVDWAIVLHQSKYQRRDL